MKKVLFLGLVMVFALSSVSFSAIRYGVGGSVGSDAMYTQPMLVVNVDDQYNILLGYKSLGQGDGEESQTSWLVGGTWYMMKNENVSAGPSLYYLSEGQNASGSKAADNTVTHTIFAFTAKAALVSFVDLRADVLLYDSVGGTAGGANVKGSNKVLSTFQLSALFYIM